MRSSGLTRAQDAVATRAAIVESAVALFCERGFAATSINDIAAQAKTPKSLVLYHFKTKENLWATCVRSKVQPFVDAVQPYLDGEGGSLEGLFRARFELMRDHPEIRRMLGWLSLEPGLVPKGLEDVSQRLGQRLREDPASQGVPAGLDPLLYFAVVIGAMDGWFRFQGLYSALLGIDCTDPEIQSGFMDVLFKITLQKDTTSCGSTLDD